MDFLEFFGEDDKLRRTTTDDGIPNSTKSGTNKNCGKKIDGKGKRKTEPPRLSRFQVLSRESETSTKPESPLGAFSRMPNTIREIDIISELDAFERTPVASNPASLSQANSMTFELDSYKRQGSANLFLSQPSNGQAKPWIPIRHGTTDDLGMPQLRVKSTVSVAGSEGAPQTPPASPKQEEETRKSSLRYMRDTPRSLKSVARGWFS